MLLGSLPIAIGTRITGYVIELKSFGAIVDIMLPDWIGIVPPEQISWSALSNPLRSLKIGQEIQAEVTTIVPPNQISLSIKRCKDNPWLDFAAQHTVKEAVEVYVTQVRGYGAFVCLKDNPTLEGLIVASQKEVSRRRITEGQTVTAYIKKMSPPDGQLVLSFSPVQ